MFCLVFLRLATKLVMEVLANKNCNLFALQSKEIDGHQRITIKLQ